MYHSVFKADPKLLTGKQLEAYEMVREHFESKTHRSALMCLARQEQSVPQASPGR